MMQMLILGLFVGCATQQQTEPNIVEPVVEPAEPEAPIEIVEPSTAPEIAGDDVGEGQLYPEMEPVYRNKKRMSVAQIWASMVRVSGGVEWKVGNNFMWEKYSSTLGVPDYQQSVTEDLSPSIMFQKFLDDAAVHTCKHWVDSEYDGEQRLFFSQIEPGEFDSDKILLNIIALREQIHGRKMDVDDPIIASFVELHQLVMQRTSNLKSAWETVCVGFFTHPDFYIY